MEGVEGFPSSSPRISKEPDTVAEQHSFEVRKVMGGFFRCEVNEIGLLCIHPEEDGKQCLVVNREGAIEMCQNILSHYAKTWAAPDPEEV